MNELGRDKVLRAALELFGRDGVAATTLSSLRQAGGVSVGSFYHHFAGKEQVVEALFVECIGLYQAAFLEELRRNDDPRAGVAAVVAFHVRWCMDNPGRARFLFTERPPSGPELAGLNKAFFGEVLSWWRAHVHHGALPELDLVSAYVLWLGPAQELCRLWLNGEVAAPGDEQIARLGRAAWRALEGDSDDR
ncbi:TetR/AcrR family transcriptional regulator [Spirillospora sp. NPDC047279]|uniref:TetR/AcrR family transcriptional regulator n=1 Tax=Spirillospora sp. NPDC047279 TaxID=3155478 RepID=UPI0033EC5A5C